MIHEKKIDGIWYRLEVNNQESVVIKSKEEEYSGDIVIPSSFFFEGITYLVTEIGEHAFENCFKVRSIKIPSSIKRTEDTSFRNFSWAEADVYLESIESFCNIDFGVWGNPICNAKNVYVSNKRVTHLTIPGTIKRVREYTFSSCNFESITIEDGIIEIEEGAFHGCNMTSVKLPDTLKSIGNRSFEFCASIKSINIPNNTISIGEKAFADCKQLISVTGGEKVRYIGNNAFSDCRNLETFEISESLEEIGDEVFEHCECLFVTIPPNLQTLGARAFSHCWLDSITIPATLTKIDKCAFAKCKLNGTATINVAADNPNYDSREGCNAVIETKTDTLIRGSEETVIPKSIKVIGEYSFSDLHSLPSIVIPEGVVRIEKGAFENCYRLRSIEIPSTIVSIGAAFTNCCNIDVRINDLEAWCSIEFICNPLSMGRRRDGYAMYLTTSFLYINGELTSNLVIPSTVTSISDSAFKSCCLKSVSIPNTLTYIGNEAFWGCSHLSSILIPKQVAEIGEGAFLDCEKLAFITILGNPKIHNGAFSGCEGIKDVYCYSDEPPIADKIFGEQDLSKITLHVPLEAVDNYKDTESWGKFGHIIPLK